VEFLDSLFPFNQIRADGFSQCLMLGPSAPIPVIDLPIGSFPCPDVSFDPSFFNARSPFPCLLFIRRRLDVFLLSGPGRSLIALLQEF